MGKYSGAEWMQAQLDALHTSKPKKYPEIKMSSLGMKAADLLGEWQRGIYHLGNQEYKLGFMRLWNSINDPRGFVWDDNPYVWVIGYHDEFGNGVAV